MAAGVPLARPSLLAELPYISHANAMWVWGCSSVAPKALEVCTCALGRHPVGCAMSPLEGCVWAVVDGAVCG